VSQWQEYEKIVLRNFSIYALDVKYPSRQKRKLLFIVPALAI